MQLLIERAGTDRLKAFFGAAIDVVAIRQALGGLFMRLKRFLNGSVKQRQVLGGNSSLSTAFPIVSREQAIDADPELGFCPSKLGYPPRSVRSGRYRS